MPLCNTWLRYAQNKTPVRWEVLLDARGRDCPEFRCKHVNFLDNTQNPGEEEFLFTPYSVFTVLSLHVPDRASVQDPVVVQVEAAMDNTEEAEDLPLAPWY
jgi:hypothetical protein